MRSASCSRPQSARGTRDVTDARRQAEEMAREQQQIAEGVKGLEGTPVESRVDKIQQLSDRKETLESKAAALENQLDKTASDMRRTDPDAARKLSDAARGDARQPAARHDPVQRARRFGRAFRGPRSPISSSA